MNTPAPVGCLTGRAYTAGDPPAGARPWDEVRAPPGAQHSDSLKAITARQLQALVRPRPHRTLHEAAEDWRAHDDSRILGRTATHDLAPRLPSSADHASAN